MVLVKIKSEGKVTPQCWGRAPPSFWYGWQPLWPVGVFSSWSMLSLSQLPEPFPHPNKKAMCGRAGSMRRTSPRKRK